MRHGASFARHRRLGPRQRIAGLHPIAAVRPRHRCRLGQRRQQRFRRLRRAPIAVRIQHRAQVPADHVSAIAAAIDAIDAPGRIAWQTGAVAIEPVLAARLAALGSPVDGHDGGQGALAYRLAGLPIDVQVQGPEPGGRPHRQAGQRIGPFAPPAEHLLDVRRSILEAVLGVGALVRAAWEASHAGFGQGERFHENKNKFLPAERAENGFAGGVGGGKGTGIQPSLRAGRPVDGCEWKSCTLKG